MLEDGAFSGRSHVTGPRRVELVGVVSLLGSSISIPSSCYCLGSSRRNIRWPGLWGVVELLWVGLVGEVSHFSVMS